MARELERVPTDVIGNDLAETYAAGVRRLELLIAAALRRGLDPNRVGQPDQQRGDASARYRARQLALARAELARLEQAGHELAAHAAAGAYRAGAVTVDRLLARTGQANRAVGAFGGVHTRAVDVLAGNLRNSLTAAAQQAGTNLAAVFARADALEGALTPGGSPLPGVPFIGRRADDPWRRVTLEQIGAGQVGLDTRRQISGNLAKALVDHGVTDAVTGFVDAGGRRWSLDTYAAMAVRTTTREATSASTVARMAEHEADLVTISSHPHKADECTEFDGNTYSLSGDDETYPELVIMPPFHPWCLHVVTPAGVTFDDYLEELERQAQAINEGPPLDTPGGPPPEGPPAGVGDVTDPGDLVADARRAAPDGEFGDPPFGTSAEASTSAASTARREADDLVDSWRLDPGEELGAREARIAAQDADERRRVRGERKLERAELDAIDEALGPDVVAALEDYRKSGVKWARDRDLREAIRDGELTIDDVTDMAEKELAELEGRRHIRQEQQVQRGLQQRSIPCFVCGRFKRRPADVCDHCGDDPVTYGGSAQEFNRAYGYGH